MRIASELISTSPVIDSPIIAPDLVTSGSPFIVSVSPDTRNPQTLALNSLLPCACLDVQSRECQRTHWKTGHKTICSNHPTPTEDLEETPKQKAWSKKMGRWIDAWAPVIRGCLPIALDLTNHEWGRHDTHAYVPSLVFKSALSDSTPTKSLIMFMEPTGLEEDHQSFMVRNFTSPDTSA